MEWNPFLTDWLVTSTGVMTTRRIIGSSIKNQASGGKWLISEANFYTVRVYICCSDDEVDEFLKLGLDQMVEDQDGLGDSIQLRRSLEETHKKMWLKCEEQIG